MFQQPSQTLRSLRNLTEPTELKLDLLTSPRNFQLEACPESIYTEKYDRILILKILNPEKSLEQHVEELLME